MGRLEIRAKLLLGSLKGRDHSEDLGVDGRMLLKLILGKWVGRVWVVLIWLRIETGGGLL
jgi:hypothetical protein